MGLLQSLQTALEDGLETAGYKVDRTQTSEIWGTTGKAFVYWNGQAGTTVEITFTVLFVMSEGHLNLDMVDKLWDIIIDLDRFYPISISASYGVEVNDSDSSADVTQAEVGTGCRMGDTF